MINIWAIIPVKSLKDSKRRLSHLLPAQQRAILIHGLLQQELAVLSEVEAVSNILVISSDPAVWQLAHQNGAQVEKELHAQGLNHAVARGMAVAAAEGAGAALMLPADLPFINSSEVQAFIAAGIEPKIVSSSSSDPNGISGSSIYHHHIKGGLMVICPDDVADGTNALLLNPISDFTFHFGPGSYRLHVQEAQKRGITVQTMSTPGLQFDLDNENDWFAYQQLVSMPNM